jgi:hypothetical protein
MDDMRRTGQASRCAGIGLGRVPVVAVALVCALSVSLLSGPDALADPPQACNTGSWVAWQYTENAAYLGIYGWMHSYTPFVQNPSVTGDYSLDSFAATRGSSLFEYGFWVGKHGAGSVATTPTTFWHLNAPNIGGDIFITNLTTLSYGWFTWEIYYNGTDGNGNDYWATYLKNASGQYVEQFFSAPIQGLYAVRAYSGAQIGIWPVGYSGPAGGSDVAMSVAPSHQILDANLNGNEWTPTCMNQQGDYTVECQDSGLSLAWSNRYDNYSVNGTLPSH